MRTMTRSEVAVVGAVLPRIAGGERERIRLSGVPRTTYQTIRQRALAGGWLLERYVPAPSSVRASAIRFQVSQPFADRHGSVLDQLAADPSVAVLWDTPDTIVEVAFETGGPSPRPAAKPSADLQRSWSIRCTSNVGGLPAYFDFEGAWAIQMLGRAPVSFPVGLPTAAALRGGLGRSVDDATLRFAFRAVGSPDRGPPVGAFERLRFGRRLRRAMAAGAVERRFLLDPGSAPPVPSRAIERMVLVSGARRRGSDPLRLLGNLVRDARVAPFLFGYDDDRVILAGSAPAPPGASPRNAPVLGTLQAHLERIEIVREPLAGLRAVVNHRYERLLRPG